MFNRGKKEKPKVANKFEGRRKYNVRAGMPQTTLKRLEDFYELLQCDPDEDGYVITTYEEIMELTHMDTNMLTIMLSNGMIIKRTTGTSPKFKYKWDTIKPTIDMAVKLLDERSNYQAGMKKRGDAEQEEPTPEIVISDTPDAVDHTALLDYMIKDNIMIVRVNLSKIEVNEKTVIKSLMAALVE
jgi:hypothetical protein